MRVGLAGKNLEEREIGMTSRILSVVVCSFVCVGVAWAGPTLDDQETWNGGGLEGWQEGWGTWNAASLDNPGTYGRISFPDPGASPATADSVCFADNGVTADPYTGDYTSLVSPGNGLYVEFDFRAETVQANVLALYFMSDQSGTPRVWAYDLDKGPTAIQGWMPQRVRIDSFAGWNDELLGTATEPDFFADLAAVDWIGVYVEMLDDEANIFGLENFVLKSLELPAGGSTVRFR